MEAHGSRSLGGSHLHTFIAHLLGGVKDRLLSSAETRSFVSSVSTHLFQPPEDGSIAERPLNLWRVARRALESDDGSERSSVPESNGYGSQTMLIDL